MNLSQASNISSCASIETRQAPILYKLSQVNKALESLDISEIPESKVQDKQYVKAKIQEMTDDIRTTLDIEEPDELLGEEILRQFKSQFENMNKGDQYRVLTSMPIDSSVKTIQNTFGVTEHTAKRAKVLQKEKGLLSTPNPKPKSKISDEVIVKVKEFYEDDLISRQMAGKKDCVSMKVHGEKKCVQKRRILTTVREAYTLFKEKYPDVKNWFFQIC